MTTIAIDTNATETNHTGLSRAERRLRSTPTADITMRLDKVPAAKALAQKVGVIAGLATLVVNIAMTNSTTFSGWVEALTGPAAIFGALAMLEAFPNYRNAVSWSLRGSCLAAAAFGFVVSYSHFLELFHDLPWWVRYPAAAVADIMAGIAVAGSLQMERQERLDRGELDRREQELDAAAAAEAEAKRQAEEAEAAAEREHQRQMELVAAQAEAEQQRIEAEAEEKRQDRERRKAERAAKAARVSSGKNAGAVYNVDPLDLADAPADCPTGDEAARLVARLLASGGRQTEIAARLGKDRKQVQRWKAKAIELGLIVEASEGDEGVAA